MTNLPNLLYKNYHIFSLLFDIIRFSDILLTDWPNSENHFFKLRGRSVCSDILTTNFDRTLYFTYLQNKESKIDMRFEVIKYIHANI